MMIRLRIIPLLLLLTVSAGAFALPTVTYDSYTQCQYDQPAIVTATEAPDVRKAPVPRGNESGSTFWRESGDLWRDYAAVPLLPRRAE